MFFFSTLISYLIVPLKIENDSSFCLFVNFFFYRLEKLNLGCISQSWSSDELMEVVSSIPKTVKQLNMSGFRASMTDTRKIYSNTANPFTQVKMSRL